jgi:hypothetical protein
MIGYMVEIFVDNRSVWLGTLDESPCAVSKRVAAKIFKTRDEALDAIAAYLNTPDAAGSRYKIHEALRSAAG